MKNLFIVNCLLAVSVFAISCKKDNQAPAPTVVKEIMVNLAASNENPQPAGRNETGMATIKVFSNNSITVDVTLTGLAATDNITAGHFHVGDPVTNGGVVVDLMPTITGSTLKATLNNVRSTFIDTLVTGTADIYLNFHSTQAPSGIVRGQVFNQVTFASGVSLSGSNEVPAVTTTATGTALLRITSNGKLYSRVTVTNVESGDALTAAHIHAGAAGVNGAVILELCASAADFGVSKMFMPSAAILTSIRTDALYVNVHSTNRPSGIVRGQIR
ncbi:MAG: hypothetical protein RL596_2236 [Bacteroidota bacterium]|jgi:hypothetical protein